MTPILLLALLLFPVAGSEAPFQKMPFEQALKMAGEQGKIVFVDFYTTWCGPCKLLDRTTWRDERVVQWLSTYTIPLKINAEEAKRLARTYRVESYPDLVFLNADGHILNRLSGYRDADTFLREAKAVLAAGPGLPGRPTQKQISPMERMREGSQQVKEGKYEEALASFLWSYDHGREDQSFISLRSSYLLRALADLGQHYPPAIKALQERARPLREKIQAGSASRFEVMEWFTLNRALRREGDFLELYEQIRESTPTSPVLVFMKPRIFSLLLGQKRYEDLKRDYDLEQWAAEAEARYARSDVKNTGGPDIGKRLLLMELGQVYRIYRALAMEAQAANIATRVLAADQGPEGAFCLAANGLASGNPSDECLAYARNAYQLSKGTDVDIFTTLVELLDARGQATEARSLLQQHLVDFEDERDRQRLETLRSRLGGMPL